MSNVIKFKRGAYPPPGLAPGEPGWCIDTGELFIGTDGTPEGNKAVGNSEVCPNYDDAIALIEDRLDTLEGESDSYPFALTATVEDLEGYLYDTGFSDIILSTYTGHIIIDNSADTISIGGKILEINDTVLVSKPHLSGSPPVYNYKYCGLYKYTGIEHAEYNDWHVFSREVEWFTHNESVHPGILVIVRDGDHRGRISTITSDSDPFVVDTDNIYVNSIIKSSTGGNIYIQNTPPEAPQENDIWFDTSILGE